MRTYEYRIYPSKTQTLLLESMLGDFCTLYNAALESRISAWNRGVSLNYAAQSLTLRECRKVYPDLSRWSFTALQQVLRRLDKSYGAFFQRVKLGQKAGFPRFRARQRYKSAAFRVGDGLRIDKDNRLRIVGVKNSIRVKWHRDLPSKPKSAILVNRAGKWFVLFHVEAPKATATPRKPAVVGVDMGLTSLVALSNGETIKTPPCYKESQPKRRRLQRSVARKKKGSNSRRKAVHHLARHSDHVTRQRRDFAHKLSRRLVRQFTHMAVEDLNVRSLAGGMLAKSFQNAAWGQFLAFLQYKAEEAGTEIERVDPRGTSQTCICGAHTPKTLAVRTHRCGECGLIADRDVVSAQVILQRSTFGVGATLGVRSKTSRSRLASEAVCFS